LFGALGVAFALVVSSIVASPASADIVVYGDAVAAGWQDWSWGGVTRDFAQLSPVHAGSAAIGITYTGGWSGLQLGNPTALDVSPYDSLSFFVHGGGAGGQGIEVTVGSNASGVSVSQTIAPVAGVWTRIDVSLTGLGSPRQVDYIQWFNATPGAQPAFSLDDVTFRTVGFATPTPAPPSSGPALSVAAGSGRHAISPYVYGMNGADEDLARELALPVNRFGGNATTRYNWQNDTSNHASDWYFENLPNDNPNPGALPDGSSSDRFVDQNLRTGTASLLTMPLIGWTPKSRAVSCGFGVAKYGPQQSTDPWQPNCGNGVTSGGADLTGNDPTDTSTAITPAFVQGWIAHLTAKYGNAANGGVRFYDLDNEPMLWPDTHRDVHPAPTSYDEMRTRTYAYAAAIKASDPAAATLGPVEWGWTGYFWSALDWSAGGAWWNAPQDRLAHGDVPFVRWYLQQMRAYEQQHGTRILDYVDVHYYPQAGGVSLSPAGNQATQDLRLRSTRSLWDATYVDESWIGEAVRLVPMMREWVAADYPGTKLAVTEYNWGGLEHVNGALAEADVLGIFGREGLDLATLWAPPSAAQPGAYAFRMYRNYDGAGGRFGETSVQATSADQSRLAVYAAERSGDGALTLMVINKTATPLTSRVSLTGFTPAASAARWRYGTADLGAIVREADVAVSGGAIDATFAPLALTLLVVAPSGAGATTTPSLSRTPTPVATTSRTPTPVATASRTPTSIATASHTATRTATPGSTPTRTATAIVTATRTGLPTVTATPVPSATPAMSIAIGGTVRYFGGAPLAGVDVRLEGAAGASATTDAGGVFVFGDLAPGDWRVVPSRTGAVDGAVTARDAAYALQIAQRLRAADTLRALACDAGGNGKVSARDAKVLLADAVGLEPALPIAARCGSDWIFAPLPAPAANQSPVAPSLTAGRCVPGSIAYRPLAGAASGQDFAAALLGDCAGDWQPAGAAGGIPGAGITLGPATIAGTRVRFPIIVDASSAFVSLDAAIGYDPAALTRPRARRAGSARRAIVAANAAPPGTLRVAVASANPIPNGTVVVLEFHTEGAAAPSVTLFSARVDP
jgi:hypothetical protein